MPITSHQIGGYIGGQQAMFGNFSSFAQQISPGYGGPPPTYSNPMGGVTGFESPPPPGDPAMHVPGYQNVGSAVMSGIGNVGLPAAAGAMMLGGSFMPGAVGGFFRGIDPFSRGLSALGKGLGWQGGSGFLGLGNVGQNLSRAASLGAGGIARAGLMGIGSAAMTALPLMAAGGALKYGIGQMVEGAQFQNQVGGFLQNQFRFLNPSSESGYGFSRRDTADISGMVREMGSRDIMSTPQELLRVMKQGAGMGVFNAVQDARQFKQKFQEMVGAVREIANTMNTTLEGAMPFFRESRRMGFWTPQDIMRQAASTRATAATTGMSVAQVQAMQFQGAQMARSIGAQGVSGALGMQRTMGIVGGALRSGVVSEQEMSELTGGLQGPEATAALSQNMMQATARFAASGRGRWVIAALANRNMQGFDPARMQQFMAGGMSIGQIGSLARQNVSGGNAFNFVMNEERLRGQIMQMGSQAQSAFVHTIVGDRLYGGSARDQYITRRMIQRYFGGSAQQADVMARLAREAPQILAENERRSATQLDQQSRDREEMLDRSWEGLKRQVGKWWEHTVAEPLQKFGAQVSTRISEWWTRTTDSIWGRVASRNRVRGMSAGAVQALEKYAMGDTQAALVQFGEASPLTQVSAYMQNAWGGKTRMPTGALQQMTAAMGGKVGAEAAQAWGFGGDVGQAQSAVTKAQADMGGFLTSSAVMNLRARMAERTGERGFGEGAATGRGWAFELARRIRSGELQAPESIKALVAGSKNYMAAGMALAAAQTKEQRERLATGIDIREGAEGDQVVLDYSREAVEKSREAAEWRVAAAFGKEKTGFWAGATRAALVGTGLGAAATWDVTSDDVGRLKSLQGGKFVQASKMINAARVLDEQGDTKGAATLRARGKEMLKEMELDKGTDEQSRKLLSRMRSADDRTLTATVGALGKSEALADRAAFQSTVMERQRRFAATLGGEGAERLMKKSGTIAALMTGGMQYEERTALLEKLALEAGQDPKRAAELLAMTEGTAGGEDIRETLRGGMRAGTLTEQLTKKGGRGRVGAAYGLLQMMPGVSLQGLGQEAGSLIKQALQGKQEALQKILDKTDKSQWKNVEEFFNLARSDSPADRAKLRELVKRGAVAGGLAALGGGMRMTQEITAGLKLKEGTEIPALGRGGVDGIYKTLTAHTVLFQSMERALAVISKQGSVLEEPPPQGKK